MKSRIEKDILYDFFLPLIKLIPMIELDTRLKITDWAIEDRPREKLLMKGVSALSDAELLAILIGSGNRNETAVELSQRILYTVKNNLNCLGKLQINELINNFNGIGEAKAISIIAALELGKRRKSTETPETPKIHSSYDVFEIFHPLLKDSKQEEGWILLLNRANKVIKRKQISLGGISKTIIDIRLIMKEAIDCFASGLVLVHNHPSGNLCPSGDDDSTTQKLKDACQLMSINILDHLIVADGSYFSYHDEKRILTINN